MRSTRKRRHTKKSFTKKKSKVPMIITISTILLLCILGVIGYKNYDTIEKELSKWFDSSEQQEDGIQQPVTEEQKETDETVDADGNGVKETTEQQDKEDTKKQHLTSTVGVGGYIENQPVPTEPTYVDGILLVNKLYPLPSTYNPGEDPTARAAFEQMSTAAKQLGHELVAFSGFRSYEYQTTLYNNYVSRDGQAEADRYSARPGYSEHQTGLAFDIGEVGQEDLWLTEEFGETEAGQWLLNNAHLYGFILRYPKGKEDITGFMYESWHFRYLGVDIATKVFESGLTLEEYLEVH